MSYAIELTQRFVSSWQALPPYLAEHVMDEVDRLAKGPVALSKPGDPKGRMHQSYRFSGPSTGPRYEFEVEFQYSQDEQTLYILDLVVRPL